MQKKPYSNREKREKWAELDPSGWIRPYVFFTSSHQRFALLLLASQMKYPFRWRGGIFLSRKRPSHTAHSSYVTTQVLVYLYTFLPTYRWVALMVFAFKKRLPSQTRYSVEL